MKIALSAKFKYGHATPERVETEGKGGGHLQMKTASICQNGDLNAAVKTQWPAPPPPPPTLLHTHYDGRDSEKRDAGKLDVFELFPRKLVQKITVGRRTLYLDIVVTVTVAICRQF